MKKYLFIVLLVGSCFGQMKVYSEHPTDTLVMKFETQFYGQSKKTKRQLQVFGFWECINNADCSFAMDWDYLDENGKKDPYAKSKKRIRIENILKLVDGINELSNYNFKRYDKNVTYDIGSQTTSLELSKTDEYPKLISLQNNEYRGLDIVDSKKIILKLKNWLSQEPIESQKMHINQMKDLEQSILLKHLEKYNIELITEFRNQKVVLINGRRFREGENLSDDIIIQEIKNDKITFSNGSTTVTTNVRN